MTRREVFLPGPPDMDPVYTLKPVDLFSEDYLLASVHPSVYTSTGRHVGMCLDWELVGAPRGLEHCSMVLEHPHLSLLTPEDGVS